MMKIAALLFALLISSALRAGDKPVAMVASIFSVFPNGASWGVGEEETRFDLVEVDVVEPSAMAKRSFEVMLPHDPANAALKEKIGYLICLSATEEDLESNRKYGLFLVAQRGLRPFKRPNQPPEPTPLLVIPHAEPPAASSKGVAHP
jgi:hypothetical protein